jgi:uncharacterized membrane protein YbaN (DUF454 family)
MKERLKRIAGFLLILLGLVGLGLPIIPGVLLLTAGGVCLAPSYPAIERLLVKLKLRREKALNEGKTDQHVR